MVVWAGDDRANGLRLERLSYLKAVFMLTEEPMDDMVVEEEDSGEEGEESD